MDDYSGDDAASAYVIDDDFGAGPKGSCELRCSTAFDCSSKQDRAVAKDADEWIRFIVCFDGLREYRMVVGTEPAQIVQCLTVITLYLLLNFVLKEGDGCRGQSCLGRFGVKGTACSRSLVCRTCNKLRGSKVVLTMCCSISTTGVVRRLSS